MVRPLLISCVKTGDKYSHEYVTRLRDGVARHLSIPHQFLCFTDDPVEGVECSPLPMDLPGWWAKVGLAKVGTPMLYLDLDVIITGDLREVAEWEGFGIIKDWYLPGFNSSVMKFTGDEDDIWRAFEPSVMSRIKTGDQQWFTMMRPDAKTFPAEWFPSYKGMSDHGSPPSGTKAVIFHGNPKPHDIKEGWVPELWR